MRFLLDQHLPASMIAVLQELGHEALHVKHLQMMQASDVEIWQRAKVLEAVMVTKDVDFITLAASDPAGPKVVRIRLGNCPNRVLFERVRVAWPSVVERLQVLSARVIDIR
ncbi:MAG TPA: DUF5615 family PIN-like protein [Caulobacteraceae bacterium]